jgi:hypothetical protein
MKPMAPQKLSGSIQFQARIPDNIDIIHVDLNNTAKFM